nr:hypothetical protein [Tanacetum cinerariifolium]
VILEEPACSTRTLSSLPHLAKDLSFGDLFFKDNPFKADNKKTTTETKAESMVSVTIQQDTFAIPPMTTLIIDLTSRPDSPNVHRPLQVMVTETTTTTTIHPPPPQPQQSSTYSMLMKHIGPSGTLGSPGASGSSQVPPTPPPPPSTNQEGRSNGSVAPSSSKTVASAEFKAWTMTDTRLRPSVSPTPKDLQMDDDMAPDAQVHSSDDEDIGNAYIPKASAFAFTYSPPPEDSLLAQIGPTFELVKVFHPNVIHLHYQMEDCHKLLTDSVDDTIIRHNVSQPLLLGGPPGQVTIQSDFFFNKDLEYLRYGSKGSRPALSISKMKAAYYPDVGLEPMDATGFEYKHNYTVIDSSRAVTFREKYGVQMIMRFNEIHKFSDGTLHQTDEALDYQVKELKVNWMNLGLNTRFWTRKEVDRSKEFMFAIQKRLKTRRIFRNLERFVGGRVRDGDYRLLKRTE